MTPEQLSLVNEEVLRLMRERGFAHLTPIIGNIKADQGARGTGNR
jgi:hypothetical protein